MSKLKYKLLTTLSFGDELNSILKYYGVSNCNLFLKPNEVSIESYDLFDNIQLACEKYLYHVKNSHVISLVTDPDTDGQTSASVMYQYTKRINPNIKINVYHHKGKVHGLSDLIDVIEQDDSDLVIVPDAGTDNVKECARLYAVGKEVIVLDHHNVDPTLNPAIIVNNQLSPKVTDKAMTGVGVVYKFCKKLDNMLNLSYADDYLDLVCVGMIADRADMFNPQTRYYVFKGLELIRKKENHNKFISTLVEAQSFSMSGRVTIDGIGFYVAPLINSLIRLGTLEDKDIMFRAMCNSDEMLVRKILGKGEVAITIQEYSLKDCQSYNRKQKKLTEEQTNALHEDIANYNLDQYPILVCNAKDNVDGSFTGLIANKLTDIYKKTVLLLRKKGNDCKGSARGYGKCEITDFNKWCKSTNLFTQVSGHANAFGATIPFENTNKLFEILSTLKVEPFVYHVFGEYDVSKLSDQIIKNMGSYDYVWGCGVDEPLFVLKNINCNKFNITLSGSKQNKIEFTYRNIKFVKQTRSTSLANLYKEIIETGDNINFTVIGKFRIDYKNDKSPMVIIEDMEFEKSNRVQSLFG